LCLRIRSGKCECLGFSISAYAQDTNQVDVLSVEKEYLKSLGVTQDYLDLIPEEKIHAMYERYFSQTRSNNDITYEWGGYETFVKDIIDINPDNPSTRGTISTAKLQLTIAYMNEVYGTEIRGITVEISYKWLSIPIFLDEDAITVNWDSTLFNSDGFYSDMGGEFISDRYVSFKYISQPNKMGSGGLGWLVPLTDGKHPGELPVKLYGGGAIHLFPTQTPLYTSSGRTFLLIMDYTHRYMSIGVSLGFSINGGSVGISTTTATDNLHCEYKWKAIVASGSNN